MPRQKSLLFPFGQTQRQGETLVNSVANAVNQTWMHQSVFVTASMLLFCGKKETGQEGTYTVRRIINNPKGMLN